MTNKITFRRIDSEVYEIFLGDINLGSLIRDDDYVDVGVVACNLRPIARWEVEWCGPTEWVTAAWENKHRNAPEAIRRVLDAGDKLNTMKATVRALATEPR